MEWLERFWHDPIFRSRLTDDNWPFFVQEKDSRISFRSLASIFIASAMYRPLLEELPISRWNPIEFHHLFFELHHETSQSNVDDPRLFTDPDWVLNRHRRILERLKQVDRSYFLKFIALHQARVECKESVPVQLFPFSREPDAYSPRTVVIDPELRFGRPTVKGAPTDVLAERWRAGDSAADLAKDYDLSVDEVEEALRYEAAPQNPPFLFPFPLFGW